MLGEDTTKEKLAFGQSDQEAQSDVDMPQEDKDDMESRRLFIKSANEAIKKWKSKYDNDFKRMRDNMAFIGSIQWDGQKKIDYDKYVANFCNQLIRQKVSRLYARNPQFSAERRKRLVFKLWDGKQETAVNALAAIQSALMMGVPPPMDAFALMQDIEQGMQANEHCARIGKTLEILYQYQTDTQEPEFKTQMKQLVQRTCVNGVGYVRMSFSRAYDKQLTASHTRTDIGDRTSAAKAILEQLEKGDVRDHDAKVEQLKILIASIENSVVDNEQGDIQERLLFDFPSSTAIIPDSNTRCLVGFIGTEQLAQEYILPLAYVNDYFELRGDDKIKCGGEVVQYNEKGESLQPNAGGEEKEALVCVWDLISRKTKSHCLICDGWHKNYVQAPEPVEPMTKRFWPIFPLCFNPVETEKGSDCSIFPPSDIDLIKSAQKEHNRTREALREHRKANAPLYVTTKGMISDRDKDKIVGAEPNEIIELQNIPTGGDVDKAFVPKSKVGIDPALYDSKMYAEDTLITTGTQEANLGPPQPNTTATGNTIAEQSRMSTQGSNVDDIDDLLSAMAEAGEEMMLREFSPETVARIVGPGYAWPTNPQERADYVNELLLQVKAASSGRPNQAIAVANIERLAPLLLQFGANPQAVIREIVKRLDDQLEVSDFFPLPGMGAVATPIPGQAPPQGQGAPPNDPRQPLPQIPSGTSVPLVAG